MRRILMALAVVGALHVGLATPWRLLLLAGETLFVVPSNQRLVEDNSRYWEAQDLQLRLEKAGWKVEYVPLDQFYGLTTYQEHHIQVNDSLHWTDRYRVLLHEAAHAYHPWYIAGRAEGEVFAEAVSVIACRCGYREGARYLASARFYLPVMFLYAGDIYRVADDLR